MKLLFPYVGERAQGWGRARRLGGCVRRRVKLKARLRPQHFVAGSFACYLLDRCGCDTIFQWLTQSERWDRQTDRTAGMNTRPAGVI